MANHPVSKKTVTTVKSLLRWALWFTTLYRILRIGVFVLLALVIGAAIVQDEDTRFYAGAGLIYVIFLFGLYIISFHLCFWAGMLLNISDEEELRAEMLRYQKEIEEEYK